ncbi:hypothetical protein [Thermosulfuriphilus sp.]
MDDRERLKVLIPHWIEHNEEHAREFEAWAEKAAEAASDLKEAAKLIFAANEALKRAAEKL